MTAGLMAGKAQPDAPEAVLQRLLTRRTANLQATGASSSARPRSSSATGVVREQMVCGRSFEAFQPNSLCQSHSLASSRSWSIAGRVPPNPRFGVDR